MTIVQNGCALVTVGLTSISAQNADIVLSRFWTTLSYYQLFALVATAL